MLRLQNTVSAKVANNILELVFGNNVSVNENEVVDAKAGRRKKTRCISKEN